MSLRPVAQMKLKTFTDDMVCCGDDGDQDIDYNSAGLYIVGLQVVGATIAAAAASILSCWLLPEKAVSAVRTLAVALTVGLVCVLKPARVGRVRGVTTVFNALRPCVLLYVQVQVIEQVVHTCVAADASADRGMWRRAVFHLMILFMILSGLIRAKSPRSETDLPFAITGGCLLLIAVLPPPAQPLTGPLCSPSTLSGAADRLLRAMLFAGIYVTHVYAAAPRRNAMNELVLCVMRCGAAAVWVLGCTIWATPIALLQMGMCTWTRITSVEEEKHIPTPSYTSVDTRSDGGMSEMEAGTTGVGSLDAATIAYQQAIHGYPVEGPNESYVEFAAQDESSLGPLAGLPTASMSIQGATPARAHAAQASRGALSFKLDMGGRNETPPPTMSAERLAEIAGQM